MSDYTQIDASGSFSSEGADQVKQLLAEIVRTLPDHYNLTLHLDAVEKDARVSGGNCDIFYGIIPWTAIPSHCQSMPPSSTKGLAVAVRRPRVHALSSMDAKRFTIFMKRAARELWIWSRLDHPNILPFLGYAHEGRAFPSLITAWMKNGTAKQCLQRRGTAYMMTLVKGVVCGLKYLHDNWIVHGDLKADNVLISDDGTPLLADFGISHVLMSENIAVLRTSSGDTSGTLRWMAYEQLAAEFPIYTMPTDIWAFGMTVYEFLTGKVPYEHIQSDPAVMRAIMSCKSPHGSTDVENLEIDAHRSLWNICNRCWNISPEKRPYIGAILDEITNLELHNIKDHDGSATSIVDLVDLGDQFIQSCIQQNKVIIVSKSNLNRGVSPSFSRMTSQRASPMDIDSLRSLSPMSICSRHSSPRNARRKRGSPMDIDRLCRSTSIKYRHPLRNASVMDQKPESNFDELCAGLQGTTYDKATTSYLEPLQCPTGPITGWLNSLSDCQDLMNSPALKYEEEMNVTENSRPLDTLPPLDTLHLTRLLN